MQKMSKDKKIAAVAVTLLIILSIVSVTISMYLETPTFNDSSDYEKDEYYSLCNNYSNLMDKYNDLIDKYNELHAQLISIQNRTIYWHFSMFNSTNSVLPDWNDAEYHDYVATIQVLTGFNDNFADLVDIFSIGKSVQGRDIWCIRITNEKNNQEKLSCLIDGCIHGNEWEAGEACLYLADYLLINFGNNATVTHILNTSEVYIVPLVNPDGRQQNTRWNADNIDLNRNFDVDFGRLRGHSIRIGKPFGWIKIPYIYIPRMGTLTNCGRRPFSEPETQAVRDLMKTINYHDFSFYVNCHTAIHNIVTPWSAFRPPFEMTQQEINVHDSVKNWVDENTEYENTPLAYHPSGTAVDWCFKEFHVPSFTFEILSTDYEPGMGEGKHDHLVHWMKTTLPVYLYLLVNIENLNQWQIPDIQPPLPEGVPPVPLH